MPTVSPFDILGSAQELVASGWCQGATARDERGEEVAPWSQDACTWSAAGAIAAAWRAQCGSPSQAPEVEGDIHHCKPRTGGEHVDRSG
jgi:hypothetical protein